MAAVTTSVADPQLAALVGRQQALSAAIEHRAVEVVRTWLVERGRSWLAVAFTKDRPEPPFDDEPALVAAVSRLPRCAYGSGLDVRGSFIVRLVDLDGYLGRLPSRCRDELPEPAEAPATKTVVINWVEHSHHRALVRVGLDFDPDECDLANGLAALGGDGFEFVERFVTEIRDDDHDATAQFFDPPRYQPAGL